MRRQLVGLFLAAAVLAGMIAYPIASRSGDPGRIVAALGDIRGRSVFDELIARSVEDAAAEFALDVEVIEPPYTDAAADLRAAVDGARLVFGGLVMGPRLLELADEFPDTMFVMLDSAEAPKPNTVGLTFAVEEGSFLVGAAAALESATGKVGYIGANASPSIEAFRSGFEQGVAVADSNVAVVSDLVSHTDDPGAGYVDETGARDVAAKMYEQGVDVIFVAAGRSGAGVIEAATQRSTPGQQLWAIGVDSDQCFDLSTAECPHVLTSMYKRLQTGISVAVGAYEAGTLTGRTTLAVGASDGAVGYTESGGHLAPDTVAQLEELHARIVDGTIVVDAVPEEAFGLEVDVRLELVDVDTGATSPMILRSDPLDHFALSPDGTRLAGGVCCGLDDRITIADLDRGAVTETLAPAPGRSQYGVAWSPGGEQLVVQERLSVGVSVGRLLIIDLETEATTIVADHDGVEKAWWWLAPAFSSDGARILFQVARAAGEDSPFDVWSVPVTGGKPELVARDAALPAPLADGSIAVVSGMRGMNDSRPQTISIVDELGEIRELFSTDGGVGRLRASADGSRLAFVEGDSTGDGRARIVDAATGETSIAARGDDVDWLDDDTLVVATYGP